jgi:hypothetical protein
MPIADKTLVTECCIGDGRLPVAAAAAVPPTKTPPTISSLVTPEAPTNRRRRQSDDRGWFIRTVSAMVEIRPTGIISTPS